MGPLRERSLGSAATAKLQAAIFRFRLSLLKSGAGLCTAARLARFTRGFGNELPQATG